MYTKHNKTSKPKKGSRVKGKKKKKNQPVQNNDDELMDLMEEYGDLEAEMGIEEEKAHEELELIEEEAPDKSEKAKPTKPKKKKGREKPTKVEKGKKETKQKKGKKKTGKKAPVKPKKGKRKSIKAQKLPTTARKMALTGKARKLPIEEVSDDVEIDWSVDEEPSDEDRALSDFERARMEEQMKYHEREKINLMNELVFMKTDLEQKTQLVDELKNDYDKLRSDFDGYKKRVRGEIKDKLKFASEALILELLEVLDNFDRTNELDLNTIGKKDLLKGVQLIHNMLLDVLRKDGLVAIKAKGEPFDPYVHDAISTKETDDYPHNTVLEELQKGYEYKHKVLRPTKVLVSQSDVVPPIPVKRKEKKKEPEKKKKKEKVKEKEKIKEKKKKGLPKEKLKKELVKGKKKSKKEIKKEDKDHKKKLERKLEKKHKKTHKKKGHGKAQEHGIEIDHEEKREMKDLPKKKRGKTKSSKKKLHKD